MKKDIEIPEVKNVTIAIILEDGEWNVYLINNNDVDLENTIVSSTGYGQKDGENQRTSTLRHFLETVEAKTWAMVEKISEEVLHLSNEYWVSYYIGTQIFDKKFVFVPDSIKEENLTYIKELEMEGVLHS